MSITFREDPAPRTGAEVIREIGLAIGYRRLRKSGVYFANGKYRWNFHPQIIWLPNQGMVKS